MNRREERHNVLEYLVNHVGFSRNTNTEVLAEVVVEDFLPEFDGNIPEAVEAFLEHYEET